MNIWSIFNKSIEGKSVENFNWSLFNDQKSLLKKKKHEKTNNFWKKIKKNLLKKESEKI